MNAKYLAFSRMPRLWVTYSVQNKYPFLEISVRQLRESVKTLRRFRDGLKPSQAKVLTGGGDLREAQIDVPLSVSHSCV